MNAKYLSWLFIALAIAVIVLFIKNKVSAANNVNLAHPIVPGGSMANQVDNANVVADAIQKPTIKPKTPTKIPTAFPLKLGSKGDEVKIIQRAVGVTADGIFGPKTQAAVQKKYGINNIPYSFYKEIVVMQGAAILTGIPL